MVRCTAIWEPSTTILQAPDFIAEKGMPLRYQYKYDKS
jgi:hypothetical protein